MRTQPQLRRLSLLLVAAAPWVALAQAPYPPSPVIERVEFDFSSRERRAPGSDNWPIAWAENGHQYTTWGDGGGFGGTNQKGRVSLGVARVEGSPEEYRGINLWGGENATAPAQFEGKSYGILALDDALYMWVSPGSGEENNREARLARSADRGLTWQLAEWAFTQEDQIMVPTFCQFGPGYKDARDGYVYVYSTRLLDPSARMQRPGRIDLLRVPKDLLLQREAYEAFAGGGKNGAPRWSAEMPDKRSVFEDPTGTHRLSVSYNTGLRRYLLCVEHTQGYAGNLGIFDAPEPWGTWTTVEYATNWGGFGSTFFWVFPTKWFGDEGETFAMIFTGTEDNDAWNMVRGRFIRRDSPLDGHLPVPQRQNQ